MTDMTYQPPQPSTPSWRPSFYEYRVIEVKDSMFRGKQSAESLQAMLNDMARYGWQFKHMITEDIKGRMGVGSTGGIIAVFERLYAPGAYPDQQQPQ